MFKNSSKILFFSTLIGGTMITISSNSWLGAWMGLEINLLSFIPLVSDSNNLMNTESSLKYFLTQALASAVLLFGIILYAINNNMIFQFFNNTFINMIIMSTLLLKTGTAPFHFWFPNVMEGLTWMNALMLMTWQKIAPLMLISYMNSKIMLTYCIILSVMIGSLGGLNQTSLRKLMAYSSINHLGWILAAMNLSNSLWMMYFLFYSFLSLTLITIFNIMKMFHINHLFQTFFDSKILKFFLFLNFLSLGGLPPFLGFLPKWMVIQTLTMNSNFFLIFIMVTFTLITLFFYLRLCYSAFMMNYYENNWILETKINSFSQFTIMTLSYISIFGLFMVSILYLYL